MFENRTLRKPQINKHHYFILFTTFNIVLAGFYLQRQFRVKIFELSLVVARVLHRKIRCSDSINYV